MAKKYAPRIRLSEEEYQFVLKLREQKTRTEDEVFDDKVYNILKNFNLSLEEICDRLETNPAKVKKSINKLIQTGYNVRVENDKINISKTLPTGNTVNGHELNLPAHKDKIKYGFVSDTHLCSTKERLDVLNYLYDYFADNGISTVFHGGNIIEGESSFNKNEIHKHGMTNQVKYLIEKYPSRKGVRTMFITGDDHEGWYVKREGINIGDYIQYESENAGRDDLVHLGYLEADIEINGDLFPNQCWIKIMHPGGGSAYAHSYKPQKIVESFQGGEKPSILLIGHYHKASYNYIRNVHVIQMGSTQDQTIFMRKKNIDSMVGGGWFEITRDDDGILREFVYSFIPFFDRGFYIGKDKYLK